MDYNNINLIKINTNSFFDDDFFSNITPIDSDATAKVATDVLKQQSTLKASDKSVLSEKKRKIRDFGEDSLKKEKAPNYSLGDSLYSSEEEVPNYSLQPLTPAIVLDSKAITSATVINRNTTSSSSNKNLSSSSSSSSSSSEDYLETAQKIKKALMDNPYKKIPIFPELPPEDLLECYKEWKSKSIQPIDDVLLTGNRKPRNYPLLMLDVLVKQDRTERMLLAKEYTFSEGTSYEYLGKLKLQDPKSSIVSAAAQLLKESERSDSDQTHSMPQAPAKAEETVKGRIEEIKKGLIDNPYKEIPNFPELTPEDLLECYKEWKSKSIQPVDDVVLTTEYRKPLKYPLLMLDVLVKQELKDRELLATKYKLQKNAPRKYLAKLNLQDPKSSIVSAAAQLLKESESSDPDQTVETIKKGMIEEIKQGLIDNPYKEIPKFPKLTPGDLLECYTGWKLKSIPPIDNSEIKYRVYQQYPLLILDVLVKQDPTERKLLARKYKFNGFLSSDFFKKNELKNSKFYYVQAASFFLEEVKKSAQKVAEVPTPPEENESVPSTEKPNTV